MNIAKIEKSEMRKTKDGKNYKFYTIGGELYNDFIIDSPLFPAGTEIEFDFTTVEKNGKTFRNITYINELKAAPPLPEQQKSILRINTKEIFSESVDEVLDVLKFKIENVFTNEERCKYITSVFIAKIELAKRGANGC